MDGHDREQLLDGPAIRNALKEGEIAEVGVREHAVQAFQLFGEKFELLGHFENAPANCPIQVFSLAALRQRKIAKIEQIQRRIQRLLGVMKAFEQILGAERLVSFLEIDKRLFGVFRNRRHRIVAKAAYAQNVKNQNAVVGRDGAAAFGNDGRVWDVGFLAHVLNVVNDVVGIFLQRVVDAGLEVGLRTVVVDSQASADIQIFETGAGALQLDVDTRGFIHRSLDLADVGDLAAQVKMQQLQAVLHAGRLHLIQGLQGLAHGQSEFRSIAAGRLPAA